MPAHVVAVAIGPNLAAPCSAPGNLKPRSSRPGACRATPGHSTQVPAGICLAGSVESRKSISPAGTERGSIEASSTVSGARKHALAALLPAAALLVGLPALPPGGWLASGSVGLPSLSPGTAQAASLPLEFVTDGSRGSTLPAVTHAIALQDGHEWMFTDARTAPVISDLADASVGVPTTGLRAGLRLESGGGGASLLEGELPMSRPALPKQYVKDAKDLIAALKTTINKEADGASEFEMRRSADGAKELVKKFVSEWQRNQLVANDETCINITTAIRELGKFYSANGPRAALNAETRNLILGLLDNASERL
eukprot:jgi/Mesvir1/5281/Mv15388-RA.1